jgi:AraC-like DNA-binding protein/quercetin dioxygenase-like cupin family protein
MSQLMPPKGHDKSVRRSIPGLPSLPRPVYGRTESLPNRALTRRHSHPWVQLSYAIQGVLEVQTSAGRFVAPPERAVWIPAGMPHRVFSSPRTEMRSLYLDCSVTAWAPQRCHVLGVSDLLRELIHAFSKIPVEYEQDGAQGRLTQVLLDQLAEAPQIDLMLPLPQDSRLRQIYHSLQLHPEQQTTLAHWSQKFDVSEKTLSRLFVRDTGLTFRAWRQRLRLLGALTPLEQGARVTDVSLACGYDSTSAFIAAFRQQFGDTPGEFFR